MNISKLDSFVYYQDKSFYYFWKPAGLASTRGKSVSFLDLMCDETYNGSVRNIVESQIKFFGKKKELGLLNRLDGGTTGLLYFAKNIKVYNKFREQQQEYKIDKYYLAVVYGNIQKWMKENGRIISYPIMHHRYNDDRMVVICGEEDKLKGKGNIHEIGTEIVEVEYDEKENRSIILIKIHKGIRHQIRAHLSSIGYPICGDSIYCKSKNQGLDKLQLFSVGMCVNGL